MFRVAIITASDKGARGEREDLSGPTIRNIIEEAGGIVVSYHILPDDQETLEEKLVELADLTRVDLILTTGGTGFSPRDVTPEATLGVIHRHVPGIAEVMRMESLKVTPKAMLSRGIAGIRGRTLIINLPGSPKAVRECLTAILPALDHGIEILRGKASECGE